ncbi:Asphd2, partial [Symbiodinium sp. KB8]
DALLQADPEGYLFEEVARQQPSEMAPSRAGWVRLDLINGAGFGQLCSLAALRPSCELLASRPEINGNCTAYLAGAALARLLPGSEIKPHFDTHCRLAAHLGLRSVAGASMRVGGEVASWQEGKVLVFDDTFVHSVVHEGLEPRYVLVSWFCHPCDRNFRSRLSSGWLEANPLPGHCGDGGGEPLVEGYGDRL